MRSFISFQPGETRSCVGCHETRETAGLQHPNRSNRAWMPAHPALLEAPWGNRPISFLRDVQPVLDEHCVRCHSGLNPKSGLDFSGGLIAWDEEVPHYGHNRAFETILQHALVSLSPARMQDASITPPLAYGSHNSKLLAALNKPPHGEEASLTEEERLRLTIWMDANAPYHDRFVNKRSGEEVYTIAVDHTLLQEIRQVHERRCAACHEPDAISRLDWINLQRPEQSLFLTAPLAQSAGGNQRCGTGVYADREDPDYAALNVLVQNAAARAWRHPRRDMQSLNRLAWFFASSR
jgi:mono/diheme cytochrome c family protein